MTDITPEKLATLNALITVASTAYHALEDSEEREGDDGREHVIPSFNFDELSSALDALDEIPAPDDSDQIYSGPMRAASAVRALLNHIEQLTARAEAAEAKLRELEQQEPVTYRYRYLSPVSGLSVWRDKAGQWNGQSKPLETQALYARPIPAAVIVPEEWRVALGACVAALSECIPCMEPECKASQEDYRDAALASAMKLLAAGRGVTCAHFHGPSQRGSYSSFSGSC